MLMGREDAQVVQLLIGMESKPATGVQSRLIRLVEGYQETSPNEDEITVHLHDVLPPERGSEREAMFRRWMEAGRAGTLPDLDEQHFHWCDLSDVAAAVAGLLKHPCKDGTYHMSGRRAWTMHETWQEFDALVQRTIAGQTGKFGTEHLESRGVPSVEAVPSRTEKPSVFDPIWDRFMVR